ncbi:MAG TPA: hypothetical protein VNC16_08670 [Solirubrobacterales bacterium]|jgi:hypothetical protein|nr:hypothetical protein [Solirubrobacterales bacterium]
MNDDQTPINARPRRRREEALEDLSLALRDNLLWPAEDYFRSLGDGGRALVAGGAVVLALGLGIGGYSLASSGGSESAPAPTVAVTSEPAPEPTPVKAAPKPDADPTLQGAAPVFKAPAEDSSKVDGSKAVSSEAPVATTSNTGNPATDTFSTNPSAEPATGATASAAASVDGPPAGPAAIAVARKFADAFVVYETGAEKGEVRKAFKATATPAVTKALLQRPPRQPAGVKVPKAKVLNVVPAPSHDRIYPVSVSLLRVGATSELRLEMEQLKNKQWRVVNVLG